MPSWGSAFPDECVRLRRLRPRAAIKRAMAASFGLLLAGGLAQRLNVAVHGLLQEKWDSGGALSLPYWRTAAPPWGGVVFVVRPDD